MNANLPEASPASVSQDQKMSALFANMVMQQTNLALMFLGRVPHPESGQTVRDVETARLFIDQLEMLAVKTKGNLDKREQALIQQSLTELRLAFVEAVEERPAKPSAPEAQRPPAPPEPQTQSSSEEATSAAEHESRKKFSKKY